MIYTFLTDTDLEAAIKADHLDQVVGQQSAALLAAEQAAVAMMSSYIGQRYVVADVFPRIKAWDAAMAYALPSQTTATVEGEDYIYTPRFTRNDKGEVLNYVHHEDKYWRALQSSTNETPAEGAYWTEDDPRDAYIVQLCVDITLFMLFRRIMPRKIPDLRTDCYNEAKQWLTLIANDDLTADLPKPLPIDREYVDDIPWGSETQKDHYY